MPDSSALLALPYILPAQAQKHVTHNEAISQLDVIVQLAVTARNLASPPATPAQNDRYIVAAGATGAWAGNSGKIALYDGTAWAFYAPNAGWTAWVAAEKLLTSYDGTAWVTAADQPQQFSRLGIAAPADVTNRLTVSAPATLLNHAGAGHQLKINKSLASNTASLLFQTNFLGRAEMGTTGNDDFAIKVSADGSSFATGLTIAGATGQVSVPAALNLGGQASDPAAPINGMIWLNTTTGEVKVRSNGVSVVVASVPSAATLLPAGLVGYFATQTLPAGWLKANGALVSRTTYAALFAAIGTTFGAGNGTTTFALPDLRGEFLRGWDDGRAVDAGRVFGAAQLDAFQGHWHTNSLLGSGTTAGTLTTAFLRANAFASPPTVLDAQAGTQGTPRTAMETRPRNIALLACIKF